MNTTHENLIKAEQTANLLVSDLKAVYSTSDGVVEIVVMPLLVQAVKIEKTLKAVNGAISRSGSSKG